MEGVTEDIFVFYDKLPEHALCKGCVRSIEIIGESKLKLDWATDLSANLARFQR